MRPMNELEIKLFLKCAQGESISFGDRAWDRAKTHLKKMGHIEFNRASNSWQLTPYGSNVYETYYDGPASTEVVDDSTYEEHLERLYGHYAVNTDGLPTADEILSGTAVLQGELSYDGQLILLQEIITHLRATWTRYGSKVNPVTNAQVDRANNFLLTFPDELRVLYMRELFHNPKGSNIEIAVGRAFMDTSWTQLHHEFIGLN